MDRDSPEAITEAINGAEAADIGNRALQYLANETAIAAMGAQYGSPSFALTRGAVEHGLPLILDSLHQVSTNEQGLADINTSLSAIDATQLGTEEVWRYSSSRTTMGPALSQVILRNRQGRAAHREAAQRLALRAQVDEDVALGVLSSSSWVVMALLRRELGPNPDSAAMRRMLDNERHALTEEGWDSWISSVSEDMDGHIQEGLESGPAWFTQSPDDAKVDPEPETPLLFAQTTNDHGLFSTQDVSPPNPASLGAQLRAHSAETGEVPPSHRPPPQTLDHPPAEDDAPSRKRRGRGRLILAGLILALASIAAGAWYFDVYDRIVGEDDSSVTDEATESETAPTDEASSEPAADASGGLADDTESTDEVAGPSSGQISSSLLQSIVSFEVPLSPAESPEGGMVGNLRMALFPSSGVICSTPQGASLGESQEMRVFFGSKQAGGALTLSLGEQNVGSSYCFGARPSDIQALVASREQYYAELRSPLDGSEVRGQLSEAYNLLDTRTADEVAAARQGSSLTASDLVFNPEGGGAYVRISEGVVAFEGSVADRRAADSLLATLSDVDFGQVEVVDNLELVAASPPPSGHIVTDSILFDVGSADIGEGDQAILDTVADILNGRRSPSGPASAWRVTIVGHTDNTGPREVNQELSFERAQSVREALIQRGVDATALTIAGYGPDQPIADNATEEGQRQNRRIEFVIDEG